MDGSGFPPREGVAPRLERPPARRGPRIGRVLLATLALLAAAAGGVLSVRTGWLDEDAFGSIRAVLARLDAPRPVVAQPVERVPVAVCPAIRADVPIRRFGIGIVRASASVAVLPRVEGELVEIAFAEGEAVEAGRLLARIDPRRYALALKQAEAALAESRARLASARADFERARFLAASGTGREAAAETQRLQVEAAGAAVAANTALRDRAALDLAETDVRAPIAGRIGLKSVEVGDYLRPTGPMPLATIQRTHPFFVEFSLPETDLPAIRAAMAAGTPEVVALDRDLVTERAVGRLAAIENEIDARTGTIRLKAVFDGPAADLWPGEFVNARLSLGRLDGVTVVPTRAVQWGADGPFVFVVDAAGRADLRSTELGEASGGRTPVHRGVVPGETVVVDGHYRLQAGTPVTVEGAGTPCDGEGRP